MTYSFAMPLYCALSLVFSFGIVICYCAAPKIYDVYPEATCQERPTAGCLSLSNVLNERGKYFTSNSVLVFHDGNHILQREVVSFSNISNFTLQGYSSSGPSSPTITCVNSSLSISNVSISIASMSFSYCSIGFWQVIAVVQDSRFENGTALDGGAMDIRFSIVLFNGSNSFAGNTAERYGGAVYASRSNLTFSGSVFFTEDKAVSGGAVYGGQDSSLHFDGESVFMSNEAYNYGGAVCIWFNNDLSFNGNSSFMSNMVEGSGGAVYAMDSNNMSFSGNSSFLSNTAYGGGGAVYAVDSNTLSFSGSSSFKSNSADCDGGAVVADTSNCMSFSGNSSFVGNTAFGGGGAVYAVNSNTLSFNGSSSLKSNSADYNGGAVAAIDSNNMSFSGNSSFVSNTAFGGSGGAVYATSSNIMSFSGKSNFTNNFGDPSGGALAAEYSNTLTINGSSSFMDNAAGYGGAVNAEDSNTVIFSGNSTFKSNGAWNLGGAVGAAFSNTLSFIGNSSFTSNSALCGGAVYVEDSNTVIIVGNSCFISNKAEIGGAVEADASNTLIFNGNSSFERNTASDSGGAVGASFSNIMSFSGNSSFVTNTAKWYGAAVYTDLSNIVNISEKSSFISNTAKYGGAMGADNGNNISFYGNSVSVSNIAMYGGAVYGEYRNTIRFYGNSNFLNNTADHGGAVNAEDGNTLSFSGNSKFMDNRAVDSGGAVKAAYSNSLSFDGSSSFARNAADQHGGAVETAGDSNVLSFSGHTSFENNSAYHGNGGAVHSAYTYSNTWSFNGNSTFVSNTAEYGGALAVDSDILAFIGSSSFMSNTAHQHGGAIDAESNVTLRFSGSVILAGNVASQSGGGIALFLNSKIQLSGMLSLLHNIAGLGGGAFIQDSTFESIGNTEIIGNNAVHGSGLFAQASNTTLQGAGQFVKNMAIGTNNEGGYGGAIFARSSIVRFQGSFNIINNTADLGGGLALFGIYDGRLLIKQDTKLFFGGNLAHRRGGAIYVEDDPFTFCTFESATDSRVDETCFLQLVEGQLDCFPVTNILQVQNTHLKFDNNKANESGDVMYGGHLDSCVVCARYKPSYYGLGSEVIHSISEYESNGYSSISSDPYKVCICETNRPNCDKRQENVAVYPGQVLVTHVVAVGQMNGTVPSVIRAVSDDLGYTLNFRETQPAEDNQECSRLQYPLFSQFSQASLKLYADKPCSVFGYPLTFQIAFLDCPLGFTLSEEGTCNCDERLQKYTQNCSIQDLTISRHESDSFWVGVEGTDKLILHPHCPFDYCTHKSTDVPLHSTTNYNGTDTQCANGRAGTLCGACQPGRSLALGSSRCLSGCSNHFLILLLAFAFAGVVLVTFLFVFRLTIAEGTLSGIIFYANVLAVNQTVFFPSGERNLLTVFIAWLNLDLGIETCFFVGQDAYFRTWLQYAFPVYIWLIVGVIIVLADRSVLVAKIIGSANPVAVLATLFLLSYTKLLRATMAAFSFTTLDYPDDNNKYVWLYDGNIGYLDGHDGRHIGLFLFSGLFFLFAFLPYTLSLLFGQWIQRKLWWLSPTKQLYVKSFLDAYYAPYKNIHRYWTGLLLLLRFVMLLVATVINIRNPQDPFSNLLVILVASLVACCWVVRGLYKKWYLDLLETSTLFNLIVLVGGTYQVRQSGGNQSGLVYTSVGTVFVTFIGIVTSAVVKRVKEKVAEHRHRAVQYQMRNSPENEEVALQLVQAIAPSSAPTYSVLELVRHHPDQMSGEIELRPAASDESPDSNQ